MKVAVRVIGAGFADAAALVAALRRRVIERIGEERTTQSASRPDSLPRR